MRRLLILVTASVLALGALPCPVGADLFVSSSGNDSMLRYSDGGAFLNIFVTAGSGGLNFPVGLVFGPDGNLYVVGNPFKQVLRYNGTTGAFIDAFVTTGSGGLSNPTLLIFQSSAPIPTLSEWGMIGMGALLTSLGVWAMRSFDRTQDRRRRSA